ncbi:MAG: CoA transferase [Alphaproteobacteria bacterium]|nr:CoA transferase [Alphaproteobacteria bacterium]|tara:strand:- start:37 stop:1179 length:1143 start_codon:yes stop_codon:yes gene_type:complete
MPNGPLSGIRILEVGHVLAGPFCGMILADLGADVIKVEPPSGDMARNMTDNFTGQYNDYFTSINRNKKGVVLDLGSTDGRKKLNELAGKSHALVTNLRPSTIKKYGLTYNNMKEFNPKIVCVALTGFGLDGPYAEKPAYDYVVQALTGVMELTGDPGNAPIKAGYSAVDNSTGIMGAVGLLAKIIEGKGGQVDVSLFDTMLVQLNYLASAYLNHGIRPKRIANSGHPHMVPAQVFETKDGYVVLFISTDKFWKLFCEIVGWSKMSTDPKFATMTARSKNRSEVINLTSELLKTRTTSDWVENLGSEGIVISGVETLDRAVDGKIAESREMIVVISTPDGPMRVVGNPIKLSGYEIDYKPPPNLGEHNEDVFRFLEPINAK